MSVNYIRNRKGFTLIELLVVIAVIGILVSLLLPAVQQVRESARRTECANNIRQIGLALQNYQSATRKLPMGWQVDDVSGISDEQEGLPGWGWAARILPHLEQGNIYREFDFSLNADDEEFEETREYVIATFLCPSDPSPEIMEWDWISEEYGDDHDDDDDQSGFVHDTEPPREVLFVSRNNYSGVFGSIELEGNERNGNGLFFENSQVRPRDITDGLSHTMMCGERLATRGTVTWVGADPNIPEGAARIVGVADHVVNDADSGHFEDFASAHPIGAMFLLADGSTHFLPNTIDLQVYQALASRAGGEIPVPLN